jgi:hypothetical protein
MDILNYAIMRDCRAGVSQQAAPSDSDGWDRDGAAAPARPLRHWHKKKNESIN